MSVHAAAALRSSAEESGVTDFEWATLAKARCSDTRVFYIEMRRSLDEQYQAGVPFTLPANDLAAAEFLPGRKDRKLYLKMTRELVDLGLVVVMKNSGYTADGRRHARWYMFKREKTPNNVVFLSDHRRGA